MRRDKEDRLQKWVYLLSTVFLIFLGTYSQNLFFLTDYSLTSLSSPNQDAKTIPVSASSSTCYQTSPCLFHPLPPSSRPWIPSNHQHNNLYRSGRLFLHSCCYTYLAHHITALKTLVPPAIAYSSPVLRPDSPFILPITPFTLPSAAIIRRPFLVRLPESRPQSSPPLFPQEDILRPILCW